MKHRGLNAVLVVLILLPGCTGNGGRKETAMAEKKETLLILNVDDVGTSPDVADGVVALWKAGAISSVSLMAFGSDFDHTAALLIENGIQTGVHLALNHGRGILPPETVPGLYAPDGNFYTTVEETMSRLSLDEARREFEAQIEKVIDAGLRPGHLDSHMGLAFMTAGMLQVYRDLALKYRLAVALPAGPFFERTREDLEKAGIAVSSTLDGIYTLPGSAEETPENRAGAYGVLLSSLRPGLNHLYSHPAPPTGAITTEYSDHPIRNDDYAVFLSPRWKEMLSERNIGLTYYGARR